MEQYKILVFSDSHGNERAMISALKMHARDTDAVFFLGDGLKDLAAVREQFPNLGYWCVRGNCDSLFALLASGFAENDVPTETVATLGGKRFLLLHGHTRKAKYTDTNMILLGEELRADAVLYGHTHTPHCENVHTAGGDMLLFNPGSVGQGDGSFGVIYVVGGQIVASHGKVNMFDK